MVQGKEKAMTFQAEGTAWAEAWRLESLASLGNCRMFHVAGL